MLSALAHLPDCTRYSATSRSSAGQDVRKFPQHFAPNTNGKKRPTTSFALPRAVCPIGMWGFALA